MLYAVSTAPAEAAKAGAARGLLEADDLTYEGVKVVNPFRS